MLRTTFSQVAEERIAPLVDSVGELNSLRLALVEERIAPLVDSFDQLYGARPHAAQSVALTSVLLLTLFCGACVYCISMCISCRPCYRGPCSLCARPDDEPCYRGACSLCARPDDEPCYRGACSLCARPDDEPCYRGPCSLCSYYQPDDSYYRLDDDLERGNQERGYQRLVTRTPPPRRACVALMMYVLCCRPRRRAHTLLFRLRWGYLRERAANHRKLKRALSRFRNGPQHACFDTWRGVVEAVRVAKEKLRTALHSMEMGKARAGLNTWLHLYREKKAEQETLRAALARSSPEGRAKMQTMRVLRDLRDTMVKMRRGMGVFTSRKSIAAFNTWRETWARAREIESRARGALARMMSLEGKGFNAWQASWAAQREKADKLAGSLARMASPAGKAFNSWRAWWVEHTESNACMPTHACLCAYMHAYMARWVEHTESKAKLAAALARMSPEGRAKLAVINKLQALIVAAQAMHRAVQAFRLAAPRKAFNTWHHAEALRLQNLQAAVWLVAQRGVHAAALHRQLETLQASTVDDFFSAVDKPGPEGITPLLWAAKSGFAEVVEVLLKLSSDPPSLTSAVNEDGSSPLHLAAREGYIDCVRHLLESGANVNAINATDSSTALHWAASKNHAQV